MRIRGAAWAGVVAVGLAGGVALGGCAGEDPDPPPATSPEPTTSISESTTSEPSTTAPTMPAEAAEATAAGAEAWVRHWIDLLNYAYATGDTQPLAAVSGPSCLVCTGTIDDIQAIYTSGGRLEGASMQASSVRSPAPDAQSLVSVSVTFTETQSVTVDSQGRRATDPAVPETSVGYVLVHDGAGWQLQGIGTT